MRQKPDLEPCGEKMHVKAVYIFSHEDLAEYKRIKQSFPQKILKEVFMNESLIGRQQTAQIVRDAISLERMK